MRDVGCVVFVGGRCAGRVDTYCMASKGPSDSDRSSQFSALMIAHLANDLRLLLNAMSNCVDSLRAKIPAGVDADDDFAAFEIAFDNAFSISQELVALGAPKTTEPGVLDLNELVVQAKGVLERVLGRDVHLILNLSAASPLVQADAVQLEWLLLNLAANGRDAMPDGGTLTIETSDIDATPPPGHGLCGVGPQAYAAAPGNPYLGAAVAGCDSAVASWASSTNRARRSASPVMSAGSSLIATVRPSRVSRARNTSPRPPAPTGSSSW